VASLAATPPTKVCVSGWSDCVGALIRMEPLLKPTLTAPSPRSEMERASRVVEED